MERRAEKSEAGHGCVDMTESMNSVRGIPAARRWIFIFLGSLAFLALTVPENHTEAEDAYYYARMVESGCGAELFHRHHLLYLPVGRAIFRAARWAGYEGRALPVLIAWSVAAGAVCVTIMAALLRSSVRWAAAGLLFSYGFWRYSTTAEIYVPMLALALGAWGCAVRADRRPGYFAGSVLLGGLALLLHLAALPAVMLGIPALYAMRGRGRRALMHAFLTGLAVGAVYAGVRTWGPGTVVFHDAAAIRPGLASAGAWLGGGVAFGHTLVSGNFVFSWPAASEWIQSLLPHRMLQEEAFMGRMAPAAARWASPLTAAIALGLLARLSWTWGRGMGGRSVMTRHPGPATPDSMLPAASAWLAGSCGMALLFEPANPEMWIPVLPALWLGVGMGIARREARDVRWMQAAVLGLWLHNAVGGMALVGSAEGDYARHKGGWLAANAKKGEWILVADSHSAITWLEYNAQARVLDARFMDEDTWSLRLHREAPSRVWIAESVFHPPAAFLQRDRAAVDRWRKIADSLKSEARLAHDDHAGRVYEWFPGVEPKESTP